MMNDAQQKAFRLFKTKYREAIKADAIVNYKVDAEKLKRAWDEALAAEEAFKRLVSC